MKGRHVGPGGEKIDNLGELTEKSVTNDTEEATSQAEYHSERWE